MAMHGSRVGRCQQVPHRLLRKRWAFNRHSTHHSRVHHRRDRHRRWDHRCRARRPHRLDPLRSWVSRRACRQGCRTSLPSKQTCNPPGQAKLPTLHRETPVTPLCSRPACHLVRPDSGRRRWGECRLASLEAGRSCQSRCGHRQVQGRSSVSVLRRRLKYPTGLRMHQRSAQRCRAFQHRWAL